MSISVEVMKLNEELDHWLTTLERFLTTSSQRWSVEKGNRTGSFYQLTTSDHLLHKLSENSRRGVIPKVQSHSSAYVQKSWSELVSWSATSPAGVCCA